MMLGIFSTTFAATPMPHAWDTVADVMSMHGKFDPKSTSPAQAATALTWAGAHYAQITTGCGCSGWVSGSTSIEDAVRQAQAVAKKANPTKLFGMYWRTDFALELADCSDFSAEWKKHPEFCLKDDAGKVIPKCYIDYSQQAAADFFEKVILGTLADGTLVYVYFDGVGEIEAPHFTGVNLARGEAILRAKHVMISKVQAQLDINGKGQNLILNGLDDARGAAEHVATGAAGSMFDHWSVLQVRPKLMCAIVSAGVCVCVLYSPTPPPSLSSSLCSTLFADRTQRVCGTRRSWTRPSRL